MNENCALEKVNGNRCDSELVNNEDCKTIAVNGEWKKEQLSLTAPSSSKRVYSREHFSFQTDQNSKNDQLIKNVQDDQSLAIFQNDQLIKSKIGIHSSHIKSITDREGQYHSKRNIISKKSTNESLQFGCYDKESSFKKQLPEEILYIKPSKKKHFSSYKYKNHKYETDLYCNTFFESEVKNDQLSRNSSSQRLNYWKYSIDHSLKQNDISESDIVVRNKKHLISND